jgi:HSP20 family molecular chaperone IbpA
MAIKDLMPTNSLDGLFDGVFDTIFSSPQLSSRGQYEFVDRGESSHLYIAVPGYKSEDLTVKVHDGILTIKGEKADRITNLTAPRVDLKFRVAPTILVNQANYDNGILEIVLVRPEQPKRDALRIPINVK